MSYRLIPHHLYYFLTLKSASFGVKLAYGVVLISRKSSI